ncbi:hypothetical protein Tco_1569106 [Tanacetum coccineum]
MRPIVPSIPLKLIVDLTDDEDPTDEDGDTGMGDSTGSFVSLVVQITSGERKPRNSPMKSWRVVYGDFDTRRNKDVQRVKSAYKVVGCLLGDVIEVLEVLASRYYIDENTGKLRVVIETAKYGKIWYDKDIHDLRSIKTEFLAIAFNKRVSSVKQGSCDPPLSSLNDEIDFRISFDDSDDEDYTVIFNKNSFSYKIIATNDLKTDSKNDNDKVNMPSFPLPKPTVSYFNDLDFFKYFENEFPAIVYNDALTSKSDFLIKPTVSPQHIDEFNLKDEISFFECDEVEQNVLYFNDLFSFNVIYPNDSKPDKDNDDDKIDIKALKSGAM